MAVPLRDVPVRLSIAALCFALAACSPPSPAGPERSCQTVLRAAPAMSLAELSIRGEWNAFNPEPMTRRSDGVFEWKGVLEPRDYGYGFGDEPIDPLAGFSRFVADTEWSRVRVPDCSLPRVVLGAFEPLASGTLKASALVERGKAGAAVTPRAFVDGAEVQANFNASSGSLELEVSGLAVGRHTLRLEVDDGAGKKGEAVVAPFWVQTEPFDWSQAVIYFVLVDRFRDGAPANNAPVAGVPDLANFQGGDLQGVLEKLNEGYFEKLGANVLWLSPLEPSPDTGYPGNDGRQYSGYHGYWPVASREVQRRFGGRAALDAVISAAHARGIRVIADAVVNHVHELHPRYAEHKNDGWFRGGCLCTQSACSFDARPLDCWFASYLPDYNWKSNAVASEVEADARFWLEDVGFDGFRVDAVKHFEKIGARALSGTAREVGSTAGGFYLVGEVFAGTGQRELLNQWLSPPILDGQFDFPLYWTLVDVFARGQPLTQLDAAVAASETAYPATARMSPFLGNHDVPRFLSYAAGQVDADAVAQAWGPNAPPDVVNDAAAFAKLAQAFTFLLTARGAPLIYYGDEVGLSGAGDPDNRRMMKFSGLTGLQSGLRQHVETLGAARKQSRALREGDRATLLVEPDLWIQQRAASATEGALIIVHRGSAPRTVTLTARAPLTRNRYRDALSGTEIDFGGSGATTLTVPAGASMVFFSY
jgi:neopullulanase